MASCSSSLGSSKWFPFQRRKIKWMLTLLGTKEMQLSFLFGENNNISLGLLGLVSILAFHNPIFPIYEWNTGIFPSSIPSLWKLQVGLINVSNESVSIHFFHFPFTILQICICSNYKQAHWNDFSVYHLILHCSVLI